MIRHHSLSFSSSVMKKVFKKICEQSEWSVTTFKWNVVGAHCNKFFAYPLIFRMRLILNLDFTGCIKQIAQLRILKTGHENVYIPYN